MSQTREDLALHRRQLVIRSMQAREQLVAQSTALLPLLAVGDRVRAAALWVRQHPGTVFTLTAVVVITRPRAAWRWGLRAWSVVRLVRTVRHQLAGWVQR